MLLSLTWTVPLQLRYAAYSAIQVLYALPLPLGVILKHSCSLVINSSSIPATLQYNMNSCDYCALEQGCHFLENCETWEFKKNGQGKLGGEQKVNKMSWDLSYQVKLDFPLPSNY